MKEAPVYKNLEYCRRMMSIRSTSDFIEEVKGHNDMSAIAEGALAYAKINAPDNIDKLMYSYLIDIYVDLISKEEKIQFKNRAKRYVLKFLEKRGMRAKRAIQIREIAIHCLIKKNLSNAEQARMMGVSKSTFCEHYRDAVDDCLSFFYSNLAIADLLVKEGLKDE